MDNKDFEAPKPPSGIPPEKSQESLQKKIPSLTKASQKLIPDVLKFLYIAYVNIPIYPSGSDMVVKPMNDLYDKLADIFTRDSQIIFSSVKNILIINGERLKEGEIKKTFEESFLKFFADLRLESMSFKKGLTKSELLKFLTFLNKSSKENTNVKESLQKESIEHILLDEINYQVISGAGGGMGGLGTAHSAEDMVVLDYIVSKVLMLSKSDNALEKLEHNSKEVADALARLSEDVEVPKDVEKTNVVLKLLQRLGNQLIDQDPGNWQKCKVGLAKTLLNLKSGLRGQAVFGTKNNAEENLVKELLPELSNEEIVNIFTEAYKNKEVSLDQMRSAIKKLLIEEKQKTNLVSAIKDKLVESGLPQNDVGWATGMREFSELNLEEKIEKISKASLEDYLLFRDEMDMSLLLKDLTKQARFDLYDILLNQWKNYYLKASYESKLKLCQDFIKSVELSFDYSDVCLSKALQFTIEIFLEENPPDIDQSLSQNLISVFKKLFDQRKFGLISKAYPTLKNSKEKISSSKEKIIKIQEEIFTLEKLKEMVEGYVQHSNKNIKSQDFVELIFSIGEPAISVLVEAAMVDEAVVKTLSYFDAFLRRRIIGETLAELIKKGEAQTVTRFLTPNLKSQQWTTVKNAVELLADIRREETIALLEYPLKHEDRKIRIRTVFALGKIAGAQSAFLLNQALKENIDEVRLDIISVLGRIGDSGSLEVLKNLDDPQNQEEIKKAIRLIELRLQK